MQVINMITDLSLQREQLNRDTTCISATEMEQDKPHIITQHMANYRGVKLYKAIDNS